jgi:hypothetical protein
MRSLRLIVFVTLAVFMGRNAVAEDAPTGRLDAHVELPKDAPYVGEPLRLVLRSSIHARVASDRFEQPGLTDFDWQQFGVDASSEELVDGFWEHVVTRVLMIYPLRAGTLTIEPFRRRVIYMAENGERAETELVSKPFTIDVRARDGVGDPADFWLPAKSLRIEDRWDPEPDRIPFGETARRVVTVEAAGLSADRLPPLPRFRAPGVITFAGPVERETIVTDQGPIAKATYQWSVRPVSTTVAIAPAIRMPWFDIATRTMREAATPERRVAFLDARRSSQASDAPDGAGLLAPRALLAALLGFVSTSAAAYLAMSSKPGAWRRLLTTWRQLVRLRVAARKRDLVAFRHALDELSKTDPGRWARIAADDAISPELLAVDAALYGPEGPSARPPLEPLARAIATALWRDDM